jgi:hypothetical protein
MKFLHSHGGNNHAQPDIRADSESGLHFKLIQDFYFDIYDNGEVFKFKIKSGFKSDLASVPAAFRSVVERHGLQTAGAVIHDYIARNDGEITDINGNMHLITRGQSDRLFRSALKHFGIKSWRVQAFYSAVWVYSKFKGDFKWTSKH